MEVGIYYSYNMNGPGKVAQNLIKYLNINNFKYQINKDCDINIILQNCDRLRGDLSKCIIGPNICTLPIDNDIVMNYEKYNKLLVPSEWVKKLYMRWIPENKLEIWPVGIDTNLFSEINIIKEFDFLIYFKRRSFNDLNLVIEKLKKLKKTYSILEYGNYNESEFIHLISKSKYGIIIDNCESQGIAIQEMMSSNLPLLVWDVNFWNDRGYEYKCDATSIPYWNNICGEVFYEIDEFEEKIELIENKIYNPRKYIIDNLSIEKKINFL